MRTSDAGRCLSPQQAIGRPVDVSKHTDLEYFLDAARADDFSHQTIKNRDAMDAAERATRKTNPKKPTPDVPDMNFEHTNVTLTFMQQDDYAVKFWACICEKTPNRFAAAVRVYVWRRLRSGFDCTCRLFVQRDHTNFDEFGSYATANLRAEVGEPPCPGNRICLQCVTRRAL